MYTYVIFAPPLSTATWKTELVMQTTEHQRVPTLPKQRIATLLGEINVHLVGNGPAMVCWPSLMMTGQMWRWQGEPFSNKPEKCVKLTPPPRERRNFKQHFPTS